MFLNVFNLSLSTGHFYWNIVRVSDAGLSARSRTLNVRSCSKCAIGVPTRLGQPTTVVVESRVYWAISRGCENGDESLRCVDAAAYRVTPGTLRGSNGCPIRCPQVSVVNLRGTSTVSRNACSWFRARTSVCRWLRTQTLAFAKSRTPGIIPEWNRRFLAISCRGRTRTTCFDGNLSSLLTRCSFFSLRSVVSFWAKEIPVWIRAKDHIVQEQAGLKIQRISCSFDEILEWIFVIGLWFYVEIFNGEKKIIV